MTTSTIEKPVRVGVFDSVQQVEEIVSKLLDAGFSKKQLAVICSEPAAAEHFIDEGLSDKQPADVSKRAATGGIIGAVLGGLGAAGLVTTGGLAVVAAGFLVPAVITGGMAGSFLGAMTTRGVDSEAADYYDQAVERGKLLVAVEDHTDGAAAHLREAREILSRGGAVTIPLENS